MFPYATLIVEALCKGELMNRKQPCQANNCLWMLLMPSDVTLTPEDSGTREMDRIGAEDQRT